MKTGSGDDPFADDDSTTAESETQTNESPDNSAVSAEPDPSISPPEETHDSGQAEMQIPYKFRRSGVKDGRNRVPIYLQDPTKEREREVKQSLESEFDEDVTMTDLREAVLKVGLENPSDVQDQLEEWGYGIEFE